jgi:arsenite-transporting ATPase
MRASQATSTTSTSDRPSFRLVGGKGGVGKTTCAAALATRDALAGRRTLLITTDPAPSLADALGTPLTSVPRRIRLARGRLDAAEIDAAAAMARWMRGRAATLRTIAVRGSWLDEDDVRALMELSLPGLDEIAALLELARFGRTGRYDSIVVDAAPTGHTLRLLALPDTLEGVAHAFEGMQARHRAIVEALRGEWPGDAGDALIASLYRDAVELREWLTDPARVRVTWVALPEPMVVEETFDGLAALRRASVCVDRVLLNRMPARGPRCRWCDAERAFAATNAARLARRLRELDSRLTLSTVEAREREPVGVRALAQIAEESSRPARRMAARRSARAIRSELPPPLRPLPSAPAAEPDLLLVAGKGGVGKTTCAAAAALEIAARRTDLRVLLLSVDPAHSLADVLGTPLSDAPRAVPGGPRNLRVRELDPDATFQEVRRTYLNAVDRLFDRMRGRSSFDAALDRAVLRQLLNLSPPGLDELAAILTMTDAIDGVDGPSAVDVLVMDTAPTGHALRLLEMPALLREWTKVLMRLLLKYESLSGPGEIGALLLRLSRGLGRLQALLQDRRRTRVVAVTRTGRLPAAELRRLGSRLAALDIPVATLIVNAVGRGRCVRCTRLTRTDAGAIAALRRWARARGAQLVIAPAEIPPPHGVRRLPVWHSAWRQPAVAAARVRQG